MNAQELKNIAEALEAEYMPLQSAAETCGRNPLVMRGWIKTQEKAIAAGKEPTGYAALIEAHLLMGRWIVSRKSLEAIKAKQEETGVVATGTEAKPKKQKLSAEEAAAKRSEREKKLADQVAKLQERLAKIQGGPTASTAAKAPAAVATDTSTDTDVDELLQA
jgi:hypothetical protein